MTQRKLLVSALAVTLVIGTAAIIVSSDQFGPEAATRKVDVERCSNKKSNYYKNNKKACDNALKKVTPTPSDGEATTPDPNVTPTPVASEEGSPVVLTQRNWSSKRDNSNPVNISERGREVVNDSECSTEPNESVRSVAWKTFRRREKVSLVNDGGQLKGQNGVKLKDAYVISDTFTITEDGSGTWRAISVVANQFNDDQIKVYYRISDEGGTNNPNDAGWTLLKKPVSEKGDKCEMGRVIRYSIDKPGKYLQYKIHLVGKGIFRPQTVSRVKISANTATKVVTTPTPTATPTPTPSGNNTPVPAGEGYLKIMTKRIVGTGASTGTPTPASSSGPLLPTSPTPSTNPTPSSSPSSTTICSTNNQTEMVANVPLSIKELKSGGEQGVVMESQQTDEDGLWQGLNGERDTLPAGNYQVNFGEYDRENYRLVALCDPENLYIINSQSSEADRKAVVRIANGKTTNLIALYAPRQSPYVKMEKYALPALNADGTLSGAQKVLRLIYPGQAFTYYISYENTGGEVAKDVKISDVIPGEMVVNEELALEIYPNMSMSLDPRGGTLVTIPLGDLAAGQKGGIRLPVRLKADVFTGQLTN